MAVSISGRFVEASVAAFGSGLVAEIGEVGRDTTHGQARLAQPSSKVCERHEGRHPDGRPLLLGWLEEPVDGDDGIPACGPGNDEKCAFES